MRIGVWKPQRDETSVRIYTENVAHHLAAFGNEILFFGKNDAVPDADLVWDPSCTGAQYPNRKILRSDLPWIVTVHGASNLSLPLQYNFPGFFSRFRGMYINARRKTMWSIYKYKVAHIITVSKYAKEELTEYLNIEPNLMSVIYHGYDDNLFFRQSGPKEYLLHVSVYQPKKNVDRIIEAYQSIKDESKLPLMLVCPGYPETIDDKKIMLITTHTDRKHIAKYMKGAYAFLFPSIHESFGMPLLEAMACGTPVITSNSTACPEIIRDAGITVDPFSSDSIREACIRILSDRKLRDQLSHHALERAKDFSWEKTARLHEELFRRHTEARYAN
jgi:glycosyltransferase involved in cell wall biosynthesis